MASIPAYVATWEGPREAKTVSTRCSVWPPLQATYALNVWKPDVDDEAHPQMLWINTLDAQARGIENGTSSSSTMIAVEFIQARVTSRIARVISLPQGAWTQFDKDGVDNGGAVNVLTSMAPTPISRERSASALVEVELRVLSCG